MRSLRNRASGDQGVVNDLKRLANAHGGVRGGAGRVDFGRRRRWRGDGDQLHHFGRGEAGDDTEAAENEQGQQGVHHQCGRCGPDPVARIRLQIHGCLCCYAVSA